MLKEFVLKFGQQDFIDDLIKELERSDGVNAYHFATVAFDPTYHKMSDIIFNGFNWANSLKGADYWMNIYNATIKEELQHM